MSAVFDQPAVLSLLLFMMVIGLLFLGFPVAFSLAGAALLFAFAASLVGGFDVSLLNALGERLFGIMTNDILIAVPLFIFMGLMLQRAGIAETLLEGLGAIMSGFNGGLAMSVTIVGALLAASTGVVGATVVTMGLLSLPAMLRHGYPAPLAAGTVCAAGTLGQIIPPSIVLILLADTLSNAHQQAQFSLGNFSPRGLSVGDLFAGAFIPGLLLVMGYIVYIVIGSRHTAVRAPREAPLSRRQLAVAVATPLTLMAAVLGAILTGVASPTEAAGIGAVGALLLTGYRLASNRRRLIVIGVVAGLAALALAAIFDLRPQRAVVSPQQWVVIVTALVCVFACGAAVLISVVAAFRNRDDTGGRLLGAVCRESTMITCMVFAIVMGASIFALVFRGIGGDDVVERLLAAMPGGTLGALIGVMVLMFLLGFVLDFLEIVYIIVPVIAPVLLTMEVAPGVSMSPVWLGVLIAVNLQTSFLTPPFGFSLFYLRGVAPAQVTTLAIYQGIAPFVVIQLLMLAALWYLPGLATWLPGVLLPG